MVPVPAITKRERNVMKALRRFPRPLCNVFTHRSVSRQFLFKRKMRSQSKNAILSQESGAHVGAVSPRAEALLLTLKHQGKQRSDRTQRTMSKLRIFCGRGRGGPP